MKTSRHLWLTDLWVFRAFRSLISRTELKIWVEWKHMMSIWTPHKLKRHPTSLNQHHQDRILTHERFSRITRKKKVIKLLFWEPSSSTSLTWLEETNGCCGHAGVLCYYEVEQNSRLINDIFLRVWKVGKFDPSTDWSWGGRLERVVFKYQGPQPRRWTKFVSHLSILAVRRRPSMHAEESAMLPDPSAIGNGVEKTRSPENCFRLIWLVIDPDLMLNIGQNHWDY